MITPTVGRIVHFTPAPGTVGDQPLAAIVTYVHSDRCVNLTVFDPYGVPKGCTSVPLVQPGDAKPEGSFYCEWMPYQVKKDTGSESGERAAGTEGI